MNYKYTHAVDTAKIISDLFESRLKPNYARPTKDLSERLGVSEQMIRILKRRGVSSTAALAHWARVFDCEVWWMLYPTRSTDDGLKYPINHGVWTVKPYNEVSDPVRTVHWGQAVKIAVSNPMYGLNIDIFAERMGVTVPSAKSFFYRKDLLLNTLYKVAELMSMPLWWYAYAGQQRFEDPYTHPSLFEQPLKLIELAKFDDQGVLVTPENVADLYYGGLHGVDTRRNNT